MPTPNHESHWRNKQHDDGVIDGALSILTGGCSGRVAHVAAQGKGSRSGPESQS
jgi:hypothetical protein